MIRCYQVAPAIPDPDVAATHVFSVYCILVQSIFASHSELAFWEFSSNLQAQRMVHTFLWHTFACCAKVEPGNEPALNFYRRLGFEVLNPVPILKQNSYECKPIGRLAGFLQTKCLII